MNSQKFISWLTGILLLLIALFGFISSYLALANLATAHKFTLPAVFPLILEGGMIVFSLAALRASLHAERAAWAWVLVVGSSVLALVFNVIHAHPHGQLAMVMAAMPSLFLLLSFETFMSQIKAGVKRAGVLRSIKDLEDQRAAVALAMEQARVQQEQLEIKLGEIRAELADLRKEKRGIVQTGEKTRARALEILADNPEISGSELGRMLGRSPQLGRQLKAKISANGRHA